MEKSSDIKVSVILTTYNHACYIREALASLFTQKFNGKIQLVIADDASTDTTLSIIKEYEGCDNRFIFHYLPEQKNLGITKNYQRAFNACVGEYIAILEGDDVWISPEKLSKQVSFLENKPQCVFCGSNYFIWTKEDQSLTRTPSQPEGVMYYDSPFVIRDNLPGNFSAITYRKSAISKLPEELFEYKVYDWVLNITLGMYGPFGYLYEPLSAYRIHENGTWSALSEEQKKQELIIALKLANKLTKNTYNTEIDDFLVCLQPDKKKKWFESFYSNIPDDKLVKKLLKFLVPLRLRKMIKSIIS